MFYFFLDESGDLGHHILSPGSSRHFVITIMELSSDHDRKAMAKAVERTLKNKINRGHSPQMKTVNELKPQTPRLQSSNTSIAKSKKFPFASIR